jgi:hypothetical protein
VLHETGAAHARVHHGHDLNPHFAGARPIEAGAHKQARSNRRQQPHAQTREQKTERVSSVHTGRARSVACATRCDRRPSAGTPVASNLFPRGPEILASYFARS